MTGVHVIIGAGPAGSNPTASIEFWVAIGLLVAGLLAAAVVLYLVDNWRKRQLADDPGESARSLTSFRAMYERGELTDDEYHHIRGKMAARVKQEVATNNPSMAAGAPPAGEAPPASHGGGEAAAGPAAGEAGPPPTG